MAISRQRGFTLIELMVAVTIMGILLAFAIPNFESFVNTNRLASAANEMIASIQTARMESLRRNNRVVVCLSSSPGSATPSCNTTGITGWVTFLDVDKTGTFTTGDKLLMASTLKDRVVVLTSPSVTGKVIFRSDGFAWTSANTLLNGTVEFCIASPRPLLNARDVNIGAGSRVAVATPVAANNNCATAVANPAAS
ncbi:MAG: GspH/FimT family pseudopilin [Luteimonas sp.]